MVSRRSSPHEHHHEIEREPSHRIAILNKFRHHKKSHSGGSERPDSSSRQHSYPQSPGFSPSPPERCPLVPEVQEPLTNVAIGRDFANLYEAIVAHVHKFYLIKPGNTDACQSVIEHASTGLAIPWPQLLGLLGDEETRLATLALCIGWTILSRTLLLKLGISNSPGSTFLPPEIVECFQSFSLGKCAFTRETDETNLNFALLSRWKQILATLMYPTYVADAFTLFDSRTVNIERALQDLDPLLANYALAHDAGYGKGARLADLRVVLREGAKFAFTLFSQPSFWRFDWTSDRAVEHGKAVAQLEAGRAASIEIAGTGTNVPATLTASEIVIWPQLRRVMDGEGLKLEGQGEGIVFGEKRYLSNFGKP